MNEQSSLQNLEVNLCCNKEPCISNSELESIAKKVVEHKIDTIALMLLESHLPLSNFIFHCGLFLEPVTIPLLGGQRLNKFKLLFSKRENIERLIEEIERQQQATDKITQ